MREGGEPEGLALERERERGKKQMLENSIFELRNTVKELEKRLSSVQDEGNEWKTRYEMQVELNRQLERQISILKDKMELIRGNPTDKLSIVRIFDQMPVASKYFGESCVVWSDSPKLPPASSQTSRSYAFHPT